MTARPALVLLVVLLAGCSGMGQVCEEVEPYRPLIRGVVTAVELAAAVPFAVTRRVSCADLEAAADQLRAQR